MSGEGLPSVEELEEAYAEAKQIHLEYLDQHGVKLPPWNTYKSVWLAMLLHYSPNPVHKDEISDAVRRRFPEAGRDQQVRHLKRDGWNITTEGSGFHAMAEPFRPAQVLVNEQTRRQGRLSAKTFEELVQSFGNRCATCGARDGRPDPRYDEQLVKLQKGHQDPDKASDEPLNIIPQCQFCNRAYRRDFVFDDRGRARAVADVGPVKRARASVQREIWSYLREKFGH